MAIMFIGGHSRNVGKTSVVAGLITALPERRWTSMKITQFGHGICSEHGAPCDCSLIDTEHSYALQEEEDRSGKTDTSRFLLAGAVKSYWLRTQQGKLAAALPVIRELFSAKENQAADWIIESNSLMQFIRPDLYITVLDPYMEDFKSSALRFLNRADAIVLHGPGIENAHPPVWKGVSLKLFANIPIFTMTPPDYVPEELVNYVHERLGSIKSVSTIAS